MFAEEDDSYTNNLRTSSAALLKNAESRLNDYLVGRPSAFSSQCHQSLPFISQQVKI
jgi:hypothetical protein